MIPYQERLRQLKNTSLPASAAPAADTAAIFDALCRLITEVLQLPDGCLDPNRSFKDLGLSSLLAVRLLDRINRHFALRLGVEVLFNYGDAARLAAHVAAMSPAFVNAPAVEAQVSNAGKQSGRPSVAIIGYAGKFAGADTPEALWQALVDNRPLISPMPDYRRQNPVGPAPLAGFLNAAERFDAAFFGISPREAAAMDPVQRHFLEQAACALEHAGLTQRQLTGKRIGVYAGASGSGYEHSVPVSGKAADAYVMTGNLASMTAARVAYFLDLDGPAVTVDTACSSSLTAVHLACQALLNGEIDIAIAGGASLFIDERAFDAMARAGMTSASHACRAFDDRADGIVVAEGAGCVVLKTMAQAQANGDRIEARICASGINQDGRSNGITAPNALAQAKLLRGVLATAQVTPDSIGLIETHGTGTRLGDPIEAAALRDVYSDRASQQPLRVAALKACIGHASEAAGIAGLISALLAMRHGMYPPIAGFNRLNTHISLAGTEKILEFSGTPAVWPQPARHPRRAAVSSFGLSGTNVHLIIEQVNQASSPAVLAAIPAQPLLFVLSAASLLDLERRRKDLAAWLTEQSDTILPALAHTLMWHREAMTERWGAYARSTDELREKLVHPDVEANDPLLGAWLAGQAPQAGWLPLPACPPLALPTYPFHGPRLWGGAVLAESVLTESNESAELDPLLGTRQADGSFLREFYDTDPLVADHQVAGQSLLHAGVLLEICLAAIGRHGSGHSALSELAWLKPLAVSGTLQVAIRINDGMLSITGNGTVYATARLSAISLSAISKEGTPAPLNKPAALLASLPNGEIVTGQAPDGVFLGPSFPGPDQSRADGWQAVAFLKHAPALPALLDAAIRTAAAAIGSAETGGLRLRFPARLAQCRQLAPLPAHGFYIHARRRIKGLPRAVEAVDVTVYDRGGIPLLHLDGLTLAAAFDSGPDIIPAPTPIQHKASSWRVIWQETPAPNHSYREETIDLLIAAAGHPLATQLADSIPVMRRLAFADVAQAPEGLQRRAAIWFFDDGQASRVMDLFRLLQALSKTGFGTAAISLRIISRQAVAVGDESASHAGGAALLGLAKAAGREFPAWRVRLIDCDPSVSNSETALSSEIIERLLSEPGDPLGEIVALRADKRRFLQRLTPLNHDGTTGGIRLSHRDHIIILGGMGRLGRACARHFARHYQARLSLIGRSAETNEQRTVLEGLRALGAEARYFTADIRNAEQLQAVLDQALALHGPATLLIQAAVDPAFARLERALADEFEAALTPKTVGLENIGKALATRPIAALAVFSSIGAFTGFPANDGQASYSAACNFEAGHALQLMRELAKPVKVIHWGLWDSGDYRQEALARLQASGLEPMALDRLGDTLDALLAAPYPQLVHAQLAPQTWLDLGAPPSQDAVTAVFAEAARQALAADAPANAAPDSVAAAKAVLAERIVNGLTAVFITRGFSPGLTLNRDEACIKLAVLAKHRQLARALLNMAVRHGLGAWDEQQSRFTFLGAAKPPVPGLRQADAAPGLEAGLRLLGRCLDALPELLAGECPGTDILFPAGSMEWVEPIYRDQPVLADCSRRLAAAVVAAAAKGGRRILEIGAGTGSTAGPVLEALRTAGLEADSRYVYSDISRAFVNHGQSRFGPRLADARVLDISRPPEDQGFEPAAWDIIIASNVLHATADISQTLAHVAALSAPGGIVLINEMVEPDDFATLTFGLLDGWWESRDLDCRLADGPILSITGWQERLRSAGLQGRWAYDRLGRSGGSDGGQSIVLAFKAPGIAVTAQPAAAGNMKNKSAVKASSPAELSPGTHGQCETALRQILADVLGMAAGQIERERPFMEMGVDSLIAPQIAEEVQARLACPLRVTDIYKYGCLAALANHLGNSYADRFRPPPAEAAPVAHTATPPTLPCQDGIAIIGLSARFAGAPTLDALWQLLDEGRHGISEVARFDISPWFDANGGAEKTYARWGGFLEDYDRFDPYFFNITPAEAEVMDPQQRVLMEETWKALENAGLDPNSLATRHCGLFVGASANNYQTKGSSGLRTLGSSMAILSARMAYMLNLHGPNFPIDTGCSSSLVAVHQACQSLRSGECDVALAGGVSVNLIAPDIYLYLSDAGMISRQGVGRTFDDAADGFVPGEGAGMVVLKRLGDALADGDRIDAVIIGSGINQDGRTAGLTAPSSEAQAALTHGIYQRYGLNPADFGMIEAHGTGTPLGDPIEIQALTDTFRRYTGRNGGCAIGSIKTNIGHTMAAAGMAGIAKTVLALRHRRIPASLNFSLANRHIDFDHTPFFVPTQSVPWPEGRAAQAAVSSFGFSGTNAHIVLQAGITATSAASTDAGPWLFAVSARDAGALQRRLLDLASWLREQSEVVDLARVAETLARGRAHWRYRCAVVAGDLPGLINALMQATHLPVTAVPNDHIPQTIAAPLSAGDLPQVAARYQQGDLPDWQALFGAKKPPLALPAYPFARERFWAMAMPSGRGGGDDMGMYPVDSNHPLLNAHRVGGTAILPGTLSLELMRGDAPSIENVAWLRPLSLADLPARLRLLGTDSRELLTDGNHRLAEGRLGDSADLANPPPDFSPNIRLDGSELYRRLAAGGFEYGRALQVIDSVEIGHGAAKARLLPPAELQDDPLLLSAALLDGALQTAAAMGYGDAGRSGEGQWVPHRLEALRVRQRLSGPCTATAWLQDGSDEDKLIFNVVVHDDNGAVLAGFEGMSAHRLGVPETRPQFYQPVWQAADAPATLPAPAAIVLYDVPERLAGIVRQAFPNAQCTSISDAPDASETLQMLSALPSPLVLIQALPEQTTLPEPPATTANALAAADPLPAVRTAFGLVQALLSAGQQNDVRLLTVAAAAVDTPVWNSAAAVAGLYRTLKIEAPGIDARVLLSAAPAVLEAVLAREINAPAESDPLLYYATALTRQVRAWQTLTVPTEAAPLPKGRGTVLISGGLGGLGLALAERLAEEGAGQIALLSRSALNQTHQQRIAAIEKSGATVMTLAADVGNPRALSHALNTVRDTLGPITAVYHLAGVLHDGFLLKKDQQALTDVFHAKARGAILLDALTRNDELDAFILFGSTAAVFGSVGQADYGAANAFLAAFADSRRARGDKTLCVHWPLWAHGGMQPSAETRAFLDGLGMKALPSALGLEQLAQLAASAETGSALLLYGDSGLFGRLRNGAPSRNRTETGAMPLAANAGLIYLCRLLAAIVKLPPERVEADLPFEDLGIDSIAIMKLNRQMESDLGPIAKTLFFEYRTPETLAAHLQHSKAAELAAYFQAKTPTAPVPGPVLAMAASEAAASTPGITPVAQDAVAIVGVAGLYPMAADLDEFWNNLLSGRDCIGEIPAERWPLDGFYDPDPNKAATSHCKWGGFIANADCFDTRFFGISPLEAETLDPQARKFLEISWNALENAGMDPERMFDHLSDTERRQRRCGVFVGVMYGDYQLFGPEEAQKGNLIGPNADYWNIANRVSAFLDLHGPSMAVDTACSSSLSAIHLACQAIRSGDCVMAIAGGVNLCLHPRRHWILSKAGMAASDGRCHSFGAGGDGYVPGEGIGAVILKPLARAQADGDRIQGVILGSALNHGGRTSGYTVPNPIAQGDAVAAALSRSGIDPRSISYLEAHGTGTPLGDPIEIRGLARAFSEAMPENCAIGSVKGNIGHLESAAGIAGLTKVLLQMRERTLAPTLHADPPNPDIDLSGTGFRLATRRESWQGSPLRAGISSFGAGGANAHLVIEAGEQPATVSAATDTAPQLLLLSARDEAALRQRAGQLAAHLSGETGQRQSLADIAHTLAAGRKAFSERLAVIGTDKNHIAGLLHRFSQGDTDIADLWHGRAGKNNPAVAGNDPATLAAAWIAGAPPPPLPGHVVELPGYPFAKRRLWVNLSAPLSAAQPSQAPLPAKTQQFAAGQPPLSDHLIGGRALLPGAFSLLAALDAAPERSLRGVRWPVPGIAASGQALTIHCQYKDGRVNVLSDRQKLLLEADSAAVTSAPDVTDIAAIIALCPRRIEAAAVYTALASAGAEYGPSLQVLESVYCGDGIAVARLRDGCSAPAVLDAAFQLCFALIPEHLSGQALLPAELGQISVIADLREARNLIAMRRETHSRGITADFFLLDDQGKTLAWLNNFQALAASPVKSGHPDKRIGSEPEWPLRLLRPAWTAIAPPSAIPEPQSSWIISENANDALGLALSRHWQGMLGNLGDTPPGLPDAVVIILAVTTSESANTAQRTGQLLEILRRYLRDWTSAARPPALSLLVPSEDANAFTSDPCAAAVAAFLRAAARERPDWPLVTLSLPDTVWHDLSQGLPLPDTLLAALSGTPADDTVPPERAWRHGVLWQRFLAPVELPAVTPPWRDGDVMLIAGAGGLGGLLARHAAACARVSVAFLGRSPNPNAATAQAIATLQAAGRPALYRQTDLADPLAVKTSADAVTAALGPIDWLVHTALVMADAPIAGLSAEGLQSVLAPKTLGLTNLSAHIQPRRGLLLFSSSNALTANPGQAAYAAASAFVDAAAACLPYPVHVFDWGFWGETGAVADAGHQMHLARLGVLPIRDHEGLAAMEQVIAAGLPRVAILRVADHLLQPMGVDLQRSDYLRSQPDSLLANAATEAARQAQQTGSRFADPAIAVLNRYAAERLWQALADSGVTLAAGQRLDAPNLGRMLNAKADYQPLMAALAELLQRAGLCDAAGISTGFAVTAHDLAGQRQKLQTEAPETAPTLALLETCLLALGDIAAGRREAAAVLFGGGEAAVAALYRGNPVVDHFQTLVAAGVAGAVQAAEQGNTVLSLLEVGTGTGGTTGFVMQALAASKAWRYRITDLSIGLVNATAERLDPDRSHLETGRLDVSQAFAAQGVKPGSVDIVIAANVLHATADLLTVLANIKEALRPGGLLILNEATSRQDINTLTFGLTPGWWAYRDAPRRCPHGPLLDRERWLDTLAEAGFSVSAQFGLPLATGGEHPLQSVIIASADAFARSQAVSVTTAPQPEKTAAAPILVEAAASGLEQALQALIADTLRLAADELGLDDSFADHGADSILSVELVRRINSAFGIDLKSTALFNYATVRELAAYMVREHGVAGTAPAEAGDDRGDDAKQRSRRLREVIERRRAAAPVNREAEFWQRESGQASEPVTPANAIVQPSILGEEKSADRAMAQAQPLPQAAALPSGAGRGDERLPTKQPQPGALPPAPETADLDEVLRLLEAGKISVSQAMELNYADE